MPDDETTPNGDDTAGNPGTPNHLPDDHPLVKAYKATKAELAEARQKVRQAEDAEKTEMERLQGTLAERDKQLAELPATVRAQAIRFASQASRAGFLDPEDALTFLASDVDLGDEDAVKTALEDLAQRKPHLVRSDAAPKVPSRPRPKGGAPAHSEVGSEATGKKKAALALRALSQK